MTSCAQVHYFPRLSFQCHSPHHALLFLSLHCGPCLQELIRKPPHSFSSSQLISLHFSLPARPPRPSSTAVPAYLGICQDTRATCSPDRLSDGLPGQTTLPWPVRCILDGHAATSAGPRASSLSPCFNLIPLFSNILPPARRRWPCVVLSCAYSNSFFSVPCCLDLQSLVLQTCTLLDSRSLQLTFSEN